MGARDNAAVIEDVFRAIENREPQRLLALVHPDAEFCWPPSLPYGGCERLENDRWAQTWIPLQPTDAELRMDLRVVAANDDEVVGLWRQRGENEVGEHFDAEVVGLYRFRDGKLARAQMFYFDTPALVEFLARAGGRAA